MTKQQTIIAALRSTVLYAECKGKFAYAFDAQVQLADALRMAVEAGGKAAYQTAFQAGVDAAEEAGYTAPRNAVYDMMKKAGIKAPGKNGKRGKKEAPQVDASLEAWVACYHAFDWVNATRIARQLGKA